MATKINWECPYCGSKAVVREGQDLQKYRFEFDMDNRHGYQALNSLVVVCPNADCREYTLNVSICDHRQTGPSQWSDMPPKQKWRLCPQSTAKVFPNYIPDLIRADYEEACLIVDLSPKASATLARRCLQAMIRDFWNAAGKNLFEEIDKIKDQVDPETWDAMDSLRKLGNIGAHMEKDISLIVEVDQDEAVLLISLIETLFSEWYIHRYERLQRMAKIKAVAAQKEAERKGSDT
ncbi:DUF4145 domain-containing protein [Pseudomonas fluorescens]|nr:DUF4145 domain-containing protein [Pseudomonas fluorescens]